MDDPKISLSNWLRICKPGGHVIVAVPHEVYYEKLQWPSRYNHDHKWSFRMEMISPLPNSIWVQQFLSEFAEAEILLCELFLIDFDFSQFWIDQTRQDAVCQIEFVLKKVA
jgi:predicted SAM-dependent methyltransferase